MLGALIQPQGVEIGSILPKTIGKYLGTTRFYQKEFTKAVLLTFLKHTSIEYDNGESPVGGGGI